MKRRIDLTGRTFNDLTVVGKAETAQKGRFWKVKCVCGNELIVKQSDLKNQRVTSCGHEETTVKKEPVVVEKEAVKKPAPKKATKKANNGTGIVGVTQVELKSGTRYKANISVQGKNKHLGTFDTLEEAAAARKEAEELYR